MSLSVEDRFFSKVREDETGCWFWTGYPCGNGYAQIRVDRRLTMAHRWAYEYFIGDIPNGLELDHLCRTRHCVNPWHLEPVTHQVNTIRAGLAKNHCPKDHEYTPENTGRSSAGARVCIKCRRDNGREWMRAYRAKKRHSDS